MISIAMTTYNGEKYLREQLDSILNQTYKDFELIICDDCSTDSTVQIIKSYIDPRIKLFINEKNLGFKKNFEKAIKLCTGEYIALSDQDDIWELDHLKILYDKINGADLICGNNLIFNQNGDSLTNAELLYIKKSLVHNANGYFNYKQFLKYINSTMSKQGALKLLNTLAKYKILKKSKNKKGETIFKFNDTMLTYVYSD